MERNKRRRAAGANGTGETRPRDRSRKNATAEQDVARGEISSGEGGNGEQEEVLSLII
jgi:hypothetical protein